MDETILEFDDNGLLADLCGPFEKHLAVVEQGLGLQIGRRGNELMLLGDQEARHRAEDILKTLYRRLERGGAVEEADFRSAVAQARRGLAPFVEGETVEIKTKRRSVRPRTQGQNAYVKALLEHDLTFGVGPAGTGKTYLAVAVGVAMFLDRKVDKLILSRPAVEAGERLGFLPGDMKEKVEPYLRPLYDALEDLGAGGNVAKLLEEGKIEVAPLAFMRGRTLSNAFVVLDEAQNATGMQMRMFLTRLGENARMVVTGDPSQVDLPPGVRSGLIEALSVLEGVEGVAISRLNESDVVRHELVKRIVGAYAVRDEAYAAAARRRRLEADEADAE